MSAEVVERSDSRRPRDRGTETIDCIRALAGIERDAAASMAMSDSSLGITKRFLHRSGLGIKPGAASPAPTRTHSTGAHS